MGFSCSSLRKTRQVVIKYSEKNGKLSFAVQVVPRASKSEIVGEHNGALRIRIAAPPVEGAANEELVRLMARTFKVSRSAVEITAGRRGKNKQVTISSGAGLLAILEDVSAHS